MEFKLSPGRYEGYFSNKAKSVILEKSTTTVLVLQDEKNFQQLEDIVKAQPWKKTRILLSGTWKINNMMLELTPVKAYAIEIDDEDDEAKELAWNNVPLDGEVTKKARLSYGEEHFNKPDSKMQKVSDNVAPVVNIK